MSDQSHGLPYRWILPLALLLICASLLWPLRSTLFARADVVFYQFDIDSPTKQPHQQSSSGPPLNINVDLDNPQVERSIKITERRLWIPALINIPASIVALPYAIFNKPAHTEWIPKGMDFKRWRAISWPFVSLIFWWIAGRGIEALLAARRSVIHPSIRHVEAGIGAVLTIWGLIILILPLCAGNSDSDVPWALICCSGALWATLGGAIVAAKIAQRKIGMRLKDAEAPEALPS